jgi:hypothetical protein
MLRSPRRIAHFHRPNRNSRACTSLERDEAARVAPHGFGQHENPICARPRRLSPAITASNFVVGTSLDAPLDFHRSSPRFTAPASFSSLAVDVAIDLYASYLRPRR